MTTRFRILTTVVPGFSPALATALTLLCSVACTRAPRPLVEDLSANQNHSTWTLLSASGTRDGERLDARIVVAGASGAMTIDLHIQIANPPRLDTGFWRGDGGQDGRVTTQTITFLGGQSGPPSLGGTFDLHQGMGGPIIYRLNLPNTELKARL